MWKKIGWVLIVFGFLSLPYGLLLLIIGIIMVRNS